MPISKTNHDLIISLKVSENTLIIPCSGLECSIGHKLLPHNDIKQDMEQTFQLLKTHIILI